MATLSEATAAQSAALTQAYKTQQNRDAAKMAALVALFYQQRVNVQDPQSVEAWLSLMIPRLIRSSDTGAERAAVFFNTMRALEVPTAPAYRGSAALGMIDEGVRKSLLAVGPFADVNKINEIKRLDVSPLQQKALLVQAKQATVTNLAGAVARHAQAGARQTLYENTEKDQTALGWVRVTKAKPCAFCAMLASRGIQYRSFKEGSFLSSDSRFTGDGDAKVHDGCGCTLKPVYFKEDQVLKNNAIFEDLWAEWGAGGGDAALRFRRGYDIWAKTGERISWDQANEGLRAA